MAKLKQEEYAVVQHSGFGYAGNPQFYKGLEMRSVTTDTQKKKVLDAGGVVLPTYSACDKYCFKEMYGEHEGLIPNARGGFSKKEVDGLCIYIPPKKKNSLRQQIQHA